MPNTVNPNKVQGASPDQKCFVLGEAKLRDPILVRFGSWKGKDRVSIRAHYRDVATSTFRPTRRGVEVPLVYLDELIEALKIFQADLREPETH